MKSLAVVAALAMGAVAMGTATASAQNDDRATCASTKITLNDDWACVISHGDILKVSDQTWDGNGTRLRWSSSRPNTGGDTSGNCTDYNGSENGTRTCNYDWPEGTTISYQLQQVSHGDVVDKWPERPTQAVV